MATFNTLNAFDVFKGCEYVIKEENEITMQWDAGEGATFYEVKQVWVDVEPNVEKVLGRTFTTEFKVQRDRTGHFVYKVRSGNFNGTEELFSEWVSSDDFNVALVDGQPMAWRVFWVIPTPSWE